MGVEDSPVAGAEGAEGAVGSAGCGSGFKWVVPCVSAPQTFGVAAALKLVGSNLLGEDCVDQLSITHYLAKAFERI